jgi:hypothetical protein
MPSFADTVRSPAPPDEVWKLLSDPSRFREWWDTPDIGNGHRSLTVFPDRRRVVIRSEMSDLRFEWRLEPELGGTRIDVLVDIAEDEAFRLEQQRDLIRRSLERLAEVAAVAPL